MANHLTVDLASKFSALCVQDERGRVLHQADSRGKSATEFADEIALTAERFDVWLILIEDVPYGISSQAMVKPVLRLQGIIIKALADKNLLGLTLFINPQSWQKTFGINPRDKQPVREEHARLQALEFGYEPPDLIGQYAASLPEGTKVLKKHTNPLAKTMTDYIDAFLMGRFVLRQGLFGDITKLSGVQPPSV